METNIKMPTLKLAAPNRMYKDYTDEERAERAIDEENYQKYLNNETPSTGLYPGLETEDVDPKSDPLYTGVDPEELSKSMADMWKGDFTRLGPNEFVENTAINTLAGLAAVGFDVSDKQKIMQLASLMQDSSLSEQLSVLDDNQWNIVLTKLHEDFGKVSMKHFAQSQNDQLLHALAELGLDVYDNNSLKQILQLLSANKSSPFAQLATSMLGMDMNTFNTMHEQFIINNLGPTDTNVPAKNVKWYNRKTKVTYPTDSETGKREKPEWIDAPFQVEYAEGERPLSAEEMDAVLHDRNSKFYNKFIRNVNVPQDLLQEEFKIVDMDSTGTTSMPSESAPTKVEIDGVAIPSIPAGDPTATDTKSKSKAKLFMVSNYEQYADASPPDMVSKLEYGKYSTVKVLPPGQPSIVKKTTDEAQKEQLLISELKSSGVRIQGGQFVRIYTTNEDAMVVGDEILSKEDIADGVSQGLAVRVQPSGEFKFVNVVLDEVRFSSSQPTPSMRKEQY